MKSSVNLRYVTLLALLGAVLAAPVLAQPGPGMGGMGQGPRAMGFDQNNTRGWALMTPGEQAAHREKMLSLKTYEECKAFQAEHRVAMEARARDQGKTLPVPRQNSCDRMKARGLIK